MNNAKLIIAAALAAGGAAAALALGKKKPAGDGKKTATAAKKPVMKNPKTTVFSFVSGYKDPATVEVSMTYDADKVDLAVIEEGFTVPSGNPQVVSALAGQFQLQLEPSNFFTGEDFDAMCASAKVKFDGCADVEYGGLKGIRYSAGDGVTFCFPVDGYSFLLVYAFKGPDNDDEVSELPANKELSFFFENISIEIKK